MLLSQPLHQDESITISPPTLSGPLSLPPSHHPLQGTQPPLPVLAGWSWKSSFVLRCSGLKNSISPAGLISIIKYLIRLVCQPYPTIQPISQTGEHTEHLHTAISISAPKGQFLHLENTKEAAADFHITHWKANNAFLYI